MSRSYEDIPVNDFLHVIENGKNEYQNKFFHDIDLGFILEWMSDFNPAINLTLATSGTTLQIKDLNGDVISSLDLSPAIALAMQATIVEINSDLANTKGRVTVNEAAISGIDADLDGFKYYPTGKPLVANISDDSFYLTVDNKYVLASSITGATLLADTEHYKRKNSTEQLHGERGADTASPFNSGGSGGGPSSKLDINDNFTLTVIDFLNDDRFECSNNGYPWTQQNLFTYNGVNMWSPSPVPDGATGSEYIKNISGKTIYFRLAGGWETEGASYDWLTAAINNWTILGPRGGHPEDYMLGSIYSLSDGDTLTFNYRKDGSGTAGKDRVGIIMYEVGGDI